VRTIKYNFDEIVNRELTNAVKWEPSVICSVMDWEPNNNFIPMWVADMEFKAPQQVIDALAKRVEHGIYGYTVPLDEYYESIIWWQKSRHQWDVKREWIISTPGVVPALGFLVRALSEEGDHVIIQQPVYYPFKTMIEINNRVMINNELVYEKGTYRINFDDLEKKAKDPKAKLLLLCNPHNPVGRAWSVEEIRTLGDICNRNNVLVISDEIHQDFMLHGNQHVTYGLLGEGFSENCVVCTAPSKTFNLAGLATSNLIVPNLEMKAKIVHELSKSGITRPNIFGIAALTAAYSEGGVEWLEQLLDYLNANLDTLSNFLDANILNVKLIRPQATYLAWLDFREMESDHEKLEKNILKTNVLLDSGHWFGPAGKGYMRMNFACPREVLLKALDRLSMVME